MAGNERSGHYVRQPAGYDAYLPSNLPPDNPPLDLARLLLPLSTGVTFAPSSFIRKTFSD